MAGVEGNNQPFKTRLGTITQTNHWVESGEVIAYEPYVREMRIWADLFSEVEIFTPVTNAAKKGNLCGYQRSNVNFRFVKYNTQIFWGGFLIRLFQFPAVFLKMAVFIWQHDFLLIRSPGHFSLMAHILVILFRKKSITKFAGYFGHFKGERIPSIVERFLIRNFLRQQNLVLVYNKIINPNFITFFPLLLSINEIERLERIEIKRPASDIFRFYSLGRLTNAKGFDLAIRGLGELFKQNPAAFWHYHIIGDGPEMENLKKLAATLNIENRITFEGKQPYLVAMQMLKMGDAVIMPGVMEGWPKVVVEAWLAGAIPVCAKAGLLPQIIKHGENGFLFEPDPISMGTTCLKIIQLTKHERHQIVQSGKVLAKKLTSDSFKKRIKDLCEHQLALS